jgi:hypothetical protein
MAKQVGTPIADTSRNFAGDSRGMDRHSNMSHVSTRGWMK